MMLHKTAFYLNTSIKLLLLTLFIFPLTTHASTSEPNIIQKPIQFGDTRKELTKSYIKDHYGIVTNSIEITPKIITLHWTAIDSLSKSFNAFNKETIHTAGRKQIKKASNLNVSAHFLVDKDGSIYQLMPDNWMARHVIGLNYVSIGIENIGGKNAVEDLSQAQVDANAMLIRSLKNKYPTIKYVIAHYEYLNFQGSYLWLEKDDSYRTIKSDPGKKFMEEVSEKIKDLDLR